MTLTKTFSQATLNKAEEDIDNLIANFVQGDYRKAIPRQYQHNCSISNSTVTVANLNTADGYYSKMCLEILTGSKAGSRYYINSQVGNVLTLATSTEITEDVNCVIYQYAKAPFYVDMRLIGNKYTKLISEDVQQAVALQYLYRESNQSIGNTAPIQSKSLNNAGYSFTYDTSQKSGLIDRIHPDAFELIAYLTVQTYV